MVHMSFKMIISGPMKSFLIPYMCFNVLVANCNVKSITHSEYREDSMGRAIKMFQEELGVSTGRPCGTG